MLLTVKNTLLSMTDMMALEIQIDQDQKSKKQRNRKGTIYDNYVNNSM